MSQTFVQWVFRVILRLLHVLSLYLFLMWQVAKKYNLYTKVTGGQRIDMFGAEKHQVRQARNAMGGQRFSTFNFPCPPGSLFWGASTENLRIRIHTRAYIQTFVHAFICSCMHFYVRALYFCRLVLYVLDRSDRLIVVIVFAMHKLL